MADHRPQAVRVLLSSPDARAVQEALSALRSSGSWDIVRMDEPRQDASGEWVSTGVLL